MLAGMARTRVSTSGLLLAAISLLYAGLCWTGIGWGLPAEDDDVYLFAGASWPAEQIADRASGRTDAGVGADVDGNPLAVGAAPVVVNATTSGMAEIYRRYRLFSRQPDEMITIMALSGMSPRQLRFDPKLYQYGGLYIYPVGALIGGCGAAGLYPVRGDLTWYLDHPGDMGKFYMTARVYAAAWGLAGVAVMFAIGRRLGGVATGALAALLFVLLPVVTCMAHEAKPHLPGAVLMLTACWLAMRALDRQRTRDWAGLFICCGAAVGMVLSAGPIVLLIPLAIGLHCLNQTRRQRHEFPRQPQRHVDYRPVFVRATLGGWLVAGAVYLVTNPYIVINLFVNRAVLASNFGNSLNMYEIARVGAGAVRVAELTVMGATLPVTILGVIGAGWAWRARRAAALPIAVMGLIILLQFVLLGAGKPDEYGRFGVFTNCVLALGCAAVIVGAGRRWRPGGVLLGAIAVGACALYSAGYVVSLRADASRTGSRDLAAAYLHGLPDRASIAVAAEPAPYGCPPLAFDAAPVVLYRARPTEQVIDALRRWNDALQSNVAETPGRFVAAFDEPERQLADFPNPAWAAAHVFEARAWGLPRSRISWANKPIVVLEAAPRQR